MNLQDLFADAAVLADPVALTPWLQRAQLELGFLAQDPRQVRASLDRGAAAESGPRRVGDVAIVEIVGVLFPNPTWWSRALGWSSCKEIMRDVAAALADPAVRTIVLHVDSPGGDVTLVPEAADAIFAARRQKPIVAVADPLAASAAYWLASQADRLYASPSARVGSIGVYTDHVDVSRQLQKAGVRVTLVAHGAHKVDGHPYGPLPAAVRQRLQAHVTEIGLEFERAVGRGRGVTLASVQKTFGQGETVRGRAAVARRMVDGSDTFHAVLSRLLGTQRARTDARGFSARLFGDDESIEAEHEAILAVLGDD